MEKLYSVPVLELPEHLRRLPSQSPYHCVGLDRVLYQFSQPKVTQLDLQLAHEHIRWLEVTVGKPLLMQEGQCL